MGRHAHPPGIDHWRAACCESNPRGSGTGRRKRTPTRGTSPTAEFTRETAPGKRAGRKTGTAPRADFTTGPQLCLPALLMILLSAGIFRFCHHQLRSAFTTHLGIKMIKVSTVQDQKSY
jgi:hypothetical protein